MLDDLTTSERADPAQVFDDWRHAVASLTAAERDSASYVELVRLSEQVIRTRNILALDRQALGLELPAAMVRHILVDEQILDEEDDTIWFSDDESVGLAGEVGSTRALSRSLRKRELIQEATGVLMYRFGLEGGQALKLLMTVSERSGVSSERLANRVMGSTRRPHRPRHPAPAVPDAA